MGSQTMLTGGSASTAAAGGVFSPIARQPSIYSLTLQEFQSTINYPGIDFGSMNMEEFLRNVWTAEESQAMAVAVGCAPSEGGAGINNISDMSRNNTGQVVRQPSLHRQSSLSLAHTLNNKTVEEVWQDIRQRTEKQHVTSQPQQVQEQHASSLAEITLEDFLVRAGVVRHEPDGLTTQPPAPSQSLSADGMGGLSIYATPSSPAGLTTMAPSQFPPPSIDIQSDWMAYPSRHQHQQFLQQAESAAALEIAKRGVPPASLILSSGSPIFDGVSDALGLGSGLALSSGGSDFPNHSKKRLADTVTVKTFERRQKRMIKNRESAARSRARKQAYTCELEALVTHLKEENGRLKSEQAAEQHIQEIQHKQPCIRVLRRNRSWPSFL